MMLLIVMETNHDIACIVLFKFIGFDTTSHAVYFHSISPSLHLPLPNPQHVPVASLV
jgi:hypothetical protein